MCGGADFIIDRPCATGSLLPVLLGGQECPPHQHWRTSRQWHSTQARGSDIISGHPKTKGESLMNRRSFCVTVVALFCGASLALAAENKKVLFLTKSSGFQHPE